MSVRSLQGSLSLVLMVAGGLSGITAALLLGISWTQFSWPLALPSLIILAGSATAAFRTIRQDRTAFFGPLPYLPAALGLYFGLGPLVYIWGSDTTMSVMDAFFPVGPMEYLQVQRLVGVGVASTGLGLLMARPRLNQGGFDLQPLIDKATIPTGVALCLTGFVVQGLVELPRMITVDAGVPSGFAQQIGLFSIAGVVVLRLTIAAGRRRALVFWGITLAIEVTFGLLQTSKHAALMPLLIVLGVEIALGKSIRVVVPLALGLALTFPALTTVMGLARSSLMGQPIGFGAFVDTRSEALRSANQNRQGQGQGQGTEIQLWWSRLSYVNAQSFVLQDYNSGNRGSSLKDAWLIVIPRVIWPDKPIFSENGRSFSGTVGGNFGSAAAPGVLAEGYWNLGWPGAFLSGGGLGLCIGFLHRAVIRILRERWLAMTGMLILAIRLAIRVDGWIVTDYFGSVVIAVPLYAGVWLAQKRWKAGRAQHPWGRVAGPPHPQRAGFSRRMPD